MEKTTRYLSSATILFLNFFLLAKKAYADLITPGTSVETGKLTFANNQNEIIILAVVGAIIVLVIFVSIVLLIKIRKKHDNKD